jgi:hypothetical protein
MNSWNYWSNCFLLRNKINQLQSQSDYVMNATLIIINTQGSTSIPLNILTRTKPTALAPDQNHSEIRQNMLFFFNIMIDGQRWWTNTPSQPKAKWIIGKLSPLRKLCRIFRLGKFIHFRKDEMWRLELANAQTSTLPVYLRCIRNLLTKRGQRPPVIL